MRLFRRRTVNIGRDVQLLGNTVIGCDCSFQLALFSVILLLEIIHM